MGIVHARRFGAWSDKRRHARRRRACSRSLSLPGRQKMLIPFNHICMQRQNPPNASVKLRTVFAPMRWTPFFYSLPSDPSAILALAAPLGTQVARARAPTRSGTKHSISASDITAVSSAVSARAINSAAERAGLPMQKIFNS